MLINANQEHRLVFQSKFRLGMVYMIQSYLGVRSKLPLWMFKLFPCWFDWHYVYIYIYYRIISLNKANVMTFAITWNNQVGMENFRDVLGSSVTTSFYECMPRGSLPVGIALNQKYIKPWTKSPSSNRFPFFIFYYIYVWFYENSVQNQAFFFSKVDELN